MSVLISLALPCCPVATPFCRHRAAPTSSSLPFQHHQNALGLLVPLHSRRPRLVFAQVVGSLALVAHAAPRTRFPSHLVGVLALAVLAVPSPMFSPSRVFATAHRTTDSPSHRGQASKVMFHVIASTFRFP